MYLTPTSTFSSCDSSHCLRRKESSERKPREKKMEWVAASCCPNLPPASPSKGNETVLIFLCAAKTARWLVTLLWAAPSLRQTKRAPRAGVSLLREVTQQRSLSSVQHLRWDRIVPLLRTVKSQHSGGEGALPQFSTKSNFFLLRKCVCVCV